MLSGLQTGEFVYEQPAAGDIEYTFKHALTHDVAYKSLLTERRKQIHERAAQAIETFFSTSLADHYENLAYHYGRSGNASKAANYLHLVAQQAMNRSAYAEASGQLNSALEFLCIQPEDLERTRTESAVRLNLALCLGSSGRLAAAVDMLEEARKLCENAGDDDIRCRVMDALAFYYTLRLDHRNARFLREEILRIALRMDDSEMVGRQRSMLLWSSLYEGNFIAALEEFDHVYKLSARASSKGEAGFYNRRIQSRAFASFTWWALGYPERAMSTSRESFALAREVAVSPADLVSVLWWSAVLDLFLRNWRAAFSHADEAATLAHKHGLMPQLATTGPLRGWALALLGQFDEGIPEILRWRTELMRMETEGFVFSRIFTGLPQVYLAAGRSGDGLKAVADGLQLAEFTGTRILEAEMHWLKGELLLIGNSGAAGEAAQCFRDAIAIAHFQSAKSWELRATMSLARLLAKQDRRDEARAMLAEIYGWFTEGFDTADLKDAKALLDRLDSKP